MTNGDRHLALEYIKSQLEDGYIDISSICDKEEFEIIEEAISSLGALAQYRWERDVALSQLEKLGISFAEKIDGVYLTMEEYEKLLEKGR